MSADSPLVGSLREGDEGFDPRSDELDLPDRLGGPRPSRTRARSAR